MLKQNVEKPIQLLVFSSKTLTVGIITNSIAVIKALGSRTYTDTFGNLGRTRSVGRFDQILQF